MNCEKNIELNKSENIYVLSRRETFLENIVDVKGKVLEFFENIYNQDELTRVCQKLKSFNVSSDKAIKYEDLSKVVEETETLDKILYTKKSWKLLENDIEVAKAMSKSRSSSSLQIMQVENRIKNSLESLVEIKGKKELKVSLKKADELEKSININSITDRDVLIENFICAKEYAKMILEDMNVTDKFVFVANSLLENSIQELFIRKAI